MGCHGLAPWSFHVSGYTTLPQTRWDATGSPRGVFMLAATPPYPKRDGMPRARPVEFSCWRLHHLTPNEMGCHGLAPWSFHVGGYTTLPQTRWDATGSPRGGFMLAATPPYPKRDGMPRPCAVEFHVRS